MISLWSKRLVCVSVCDNLALTCETTGFIDDVVIWSGCSACGSVERSGRKESEFIALSSMIPLFSPIRAISARYTLYVSAEHECLLRGYFKPLQFIIVYYFFFFFFFLEIEAILFKKII